MNIDDYVEELLKDESANRMELQALGYYDPSYDPELPPPTIKIIDRS